jgi:poly-gamma-glutamate synthesis protein (capsule biosynthesis protein)
VEAWAVAVPHARGVHELTLSDVRAVLSGETDDWSDLGGVAGPLTATIPAEHRGLIEDALGATVEAREVPLSEIAAVLDSFLVLPVAMLHPGMQAVVVDGHDPYRDPSNESPLRLERISEVEGASVALDPVGLLFTGELIPARCTHAVLVELEDFGAMFDGTRELLEAADVAVLPLEVSLSDLGEPTPCTETFFMQGSAASIPAIADAGVDLILTIGNHIKDCWSAKNCSPSEVLIDTLDGLAEAGVATVGAGETLEAARRPAVIERDGVRIAFLAYDEVGFHNFAEDDVAGSAPLDFETLGSDVAAARTLAEHVVVAFNWGVEYTLDPTERQRRAARIAVDAGATIVFGNHPHVVQAIEVRDGALVAYSLGNFVFDQDWSAETRQSVIIEAGLTGERLLGYRLRPIAIRDRHRAELVSPAGEGAPVLRRIRASTKRLPR